MFYAISITVLFLILKFYGKTLPAEPSELSGVESP
jgi:hypothetical protein